MTCKCREQVPRPTGPLCACVHDRLWSESWNRRQCDQSKPWEVRPPRRVGYLHAESVRGSNASSAGMTLTRQTPDGIFDHLADGQGLSRNAALAASHPSRGASHAWRHALPTPLCRCTLRMILWNRSRFSRPTLALLLTDAAEGSRALRALGPTVLAEQVDPLA